MDFATLAFFAGILALAAMSPGPAVVALVERTLTRCRAGSAAFIAALALGDMLWLAAACLGLAALAATLGSFFVIVRLAGAAYLLYLAYRLWTEPAQPPSEATLAPERGPLGLFGAGLALSMGNPKTMAFYLALLPTLIDLEHLTLLGFAEMSAVIAVVLAVVFAVYVLIADRARRLIASSRAMRWLNRACGVAMAGAAVTVATK